MSIDLSYFDKQSKSAWEQAAEKSLKGKPLDSIKWLVSKQISLDPLYTAEENIVATDANILQKEDNDWWIGESFDGADTSANTALLEALGDGLNSPTFMDAVDIPSLLKEVRTDFLFPVFERSDLQAYIVWLKANFDNYADQEGCFSIVDDQVSDIGSSQLNDLKVLTSHLPRYYHTKIDVDLDFEHIAQSLANGLYEIASRIDQLIAAGIAPRIRCVLHSGPFYLQMVGVIRAFKMMMAKVLEQYGLEPDAVLLEVSIHQVASDTKLAMIGGTSQAMAAVLGGVDRLEIAVEGMHMDEDVTTVKRMCRNVHHIMKMESGLHRHPDPLSGSYLVEKLTQELCAKGWAGFQKQSGA